MTPGTKYYSYLCIIDSLKANKGKLAQRTKDMVYKFKKTWPCFEADRFLIHSFLIEYDNTKKKEERNILIKAFDKNFLKFKYDYPKPLEIKNFKEIKSK